MMTAAMARQYARYNAWADKVMFDAVAKLPPGEDVKPRTSLFKNIVHTLNHNYVIDQIWRGHLEGRDHGYTARNTPDHPPLDELWRAQREIDAARAALVYALEPVFATFFGWWWLGEVLGSRGMLGGGVMLFLFLFGVTLALVDYRYKNQEQRRTLALVVLATISQSVLLIWAVPLTWRTSNVCDPGPTAGPFCATTVRPPQQSSAAAKKPFQPSAPECAWPTIQSV